MVMYYFSYICVIVNWKMMYVSKKHSNSILLSAIHLVNKNPILDSNYKKGETFKFLSVRFYEPKW